MKRKIGELRNVPIIEGDKNLVKRGTEIHINDLQQDQNLGDCILYFTNDTSFDFVISSAKSEIIPIDVYSKDQIKREEYNYTYEGDTYDCAFYLETADNALPTIRVLNSADAIFNLIVKDSSGALITRLKNQKAIVIDPKDTRYKQCIISYTVTSKNGKITKILMGVNINIFE